MNWHKRITQARTAKSLKKSELAKLVGVSPATVTMWESGQTKKIEGVNLIKVCDILDISPIWLLSELGHEEDAKALEFDVGLNPNQSLVEQPIVQIFPDDSAEGYRVEYEVELEYLSMFALRVQWLWANRLIANDLLITKVKAVDMEPALAFGDILVVHTTSTDLSDGSIYVLLYEGSVVIRRMVRDAGEWWLTSDHADQRRFARKVYRTDETKIIGKVILRQTEMI